MTQRQGHGNMASQWSPTGKARGTVFHVPVGRHPGQTLAHTSTGKARGFLLPGQDNQEEQKGGTSLLISIFQIPYRDKSSPCLACSTHPSPRPDSERYQIRSLLLKPYSPLPRLLAHPSERLSAQDCERSLSDNGPSEIIVEPSHSRWR